jgi:hypothetical protein
MPVQIHLRLLPQPPMRTNILIWTQSLRFVSIKILFYILFYVRSTEPIGSIRFLNHSSSTYPKVYYILLISLLTLFYYTSYNSFSLSLSILYTISPLVSSLYIPKKTFPYIFRSPLLYISFNMHSVQNLWFYILK